ncbi:hypothetical protein C9374_008278 [Naegleria lovaniensis]|uniref:Hemerythrin-like domain-containing protein n=1 Tax=Naegleria lovaniensis TaxID=51637 RepID=A0AA88KFH6_NAELO|nr:uncharacterized protein C9374_010823 [Naegleria lovaniensis]XP_044545901.1 uncharacterized protein C9374_008278 [Naegleria lovaniensis]KAG2374539.1 hypothetical protein C9374_010823 [Naegleria lovaniensis]KAG2378639.1 hypothetical protein C9374_008278 [Naegleria lovaniensis]
MGSALSVGRKSSTKKDTDVRKSTDSRKSIDKSSNANNRNNGVRSSVDKSMNDQKASENNKNSADSKKPVEVAKQPSKEQVKENPKQEQPKNTESMDQSKAETTTQPNGEENGSSSEPVEKPRPQTTLLGRKKANIDDIPEFVFHSDKDLLFGADIAMPWKPGYALGVHIIDEQHKVLVKLINELAEAVKDGHMRYEIGSVFDNLVEYTDFHFKKEEDLMQKYHYVEEDEQAHKEKHELFVKTIFNLRTDFINMTVDNIGQDLFNFLTDWLLTHICQMDKKLCDFLLERNINE